MKEKNKKSKNIFKKIISSLILVLPMVIGAIFAMNSSSVNAATYPATITPQNLIRS